MQVTHCQEEHKTICKVTNIMLRRKQGKLLAIFFIKWQCLALYFNSTQSGREILHWVIMKIFWLTVEWNLQSRNPFLVYVQGNIYTQLLIIFTLYSLLNTQSTEEEEYLFYEPWCRLEKVLQAHFWGSTSNVCIEKGIAERIKQHCQSTHCFAHILLYSQIPVGG